MTQANMKLLDRLPPAPHRRRGFTLIEVVIVIAVLGILMAIAIPSYNNHSMKTRRSLAAGCLVESAQRMERFYTTTLAYNATGAPVPSCSPDVTPYYRFEAGASTATTYSVQAVPIGAQASDSCGTLTLNQAGTRGNASGVTGCW